MREWSQETKAIVASGSAMVAAILTVLLAQYLWVATMNERFNDTNKRIDDTNERIDDTNERITRVEARIDARFDKVDARFDKVDARFDRLEARFDRLEAMLNSLLTGRSLPIAQPNPEAKTDQPSQ